MSELRGSATGEVPSPIEDCWALVADIERAPRWQRTLGSVVVQERDADDRPLICDTVSGVSRFTVRVRIRVDYSPPHQIRFTQVASEDLDAMEAGWNLEPVGPELTRATYFLSLDPGPVPLLARPLEKAIRPLVVGHQPRELAEALAAAR